jgi:tetratricopeptide (TPR) repeat protein/predicted Ser/Thr protein kinase
MIGKTVLHYTITEEIGRGGMGIVYKAQDTKLKRTVALKFLPPAVGPEERARFETEAQSVAHLQHPNICGIHEINEFGGQTFIVMPFIDGVELKQLTADGPMDIAEAVMIALQVATALEDAHEHGIIHRDIKSANVMITKKGLAKVMDFGLAKRQGIDHITKTSTSLGTVDYMSPEQASGDAADHRADIWALGVVLYEMVTGRLPYQGKFEQAVVYSILNQEPIPLATVNTNVPASLERVVTKAMSKKPDDRYQSMLEMIAELRAVQDEVGVPEGVSVAVSSVTGRPSTGSRAATTVHEGSFLSRVMKRRVLVAVGAYAAIAVVTFLALKWVVNHFPVSPHLPGFVLSAFALLLPAVFVAAYFRGGHIASKIGVPVYVVAAAAILLFVSQDRDLGAATEMVRITDEDGNTIERALPKGEFRKRFALFYLDNETGDPQYDWLSYGIVQMLRHDFNQDTYLSYGLGFTRPHKEAGFDKPVGSPMTLKREFADQAHLPQFLAGSFTRTGDVFEIDITLFDTDSGRPLADRQFAGTDLFALVDDMSVQLRRDLGVPDYHIAENPDLPVADMFSLSLEALEHYVEAVNAIWQDNDYERSVELLERAIEIDPAFTLAHWALSGSYVALNDGEKARESIRLALKHKYRLPESERYNLMNDYLQQREDYEAVFENAKRWASLYPEAPGARVVLATHYERVNDLEAAIVERKLLFQADPQRYQELHSIGRLYEDIGDDEEALRHYQQYADLHPDRYESYTTIGRFYRLRGDYENARGYYKKALLVDPERMFIRTNLAEIERHEGNFEASLQQCEDALESARTPGDSVTAMWQLVEYHAFRGMARKALEYQIAALEQMGKTTEPVWVIVTTLFTLSNYVDAGRFEDALAIARSIEGQSSMPFMKPMVSAGYIITYATNEDPAYLPEVEKHVARFEEWMKATGRRDLQWALDYSKALEYAWRGDYQTSLAYVKAGLEAITPDEIDNKVWMTTSAVEIARELGDYAEAERFLEQLFALEPYSPEGHLEAALIYHAQGQTQKAIEHLKKALHVWENADPEHPRAKRARELSRQLRLSS